VLQGQATYTNQAVTMLCGAVAEVCKAAGLRNGRYTKALDALTRAAPQQLQGFTLPGVGGDGASSSDSGGGGNPPGTAIQSAHQGAASGVGLAGLSGSGGVNPAVYWVSDPMSAARGGNSPERTFTEVLGPGGQQQQKPLFTAG